MIIEKTVNAKDYLTESKSPDSDYVINPYVGCPHKCIYCYAQYMKLFTRHLEDWGDFIDIKYCKKKVSHIKTKGKRIVISTVTDPYNLYEEKYELTKNILTQLQGADIKLVIVTKSDLILRDFDLIKSFPDVEVVFSVCNLSENFRKDVEPNSSPVQNRLDALKQFHNAGVKTALFISPIFAGITDYKQIIEHTKDFVDTYRFSNLNLRKNFRRKVLDYISEKYPELTPLYNELYIQKKFTYFENLREEIKNYCESNNIKYIDSFYYD